MTIRNWGWSLLLVLFIPALAHSQCTNNWGYAEPTPERFYRGNAAYYNGNVYITTGEFDGRVYHNDVWVYDVGRDTWEESGASYDATGWTNACMVQYQAQLYVVGGFSAGVYSDDLKIYDIAADTWSAGPDLPFTTSGSYCALIDDQIHVAGGTPSYQSSHAVYDISEGTWDDSVADLPSGRAFGLGATDGELFYVISGLVGPTTEFLAYDPSEDTWSALHDLNSGRMSPGGGFAEDQLWVFNGGGQNNDPWIPRPSAEIYDSDADSWQFLPTTPSVEPIAPASAFVPEYGGLWLLFGGTYGGNEYNYTQVYSFCYAALEGVVPTVGYNGSDAEIAISGWGFEADDEVYLINDLDLRSDFSEAIVVADGTIEAVVPQGATPGTYDLVIISSSGEQDELLSAYQVIEGSADDDDDDDDDDLDDDDLDDDDSADDDDLDDDDLDDDDDDDHVSAGDDDDDAGCCG
ncbi:MAG: kelch repeat-containing protein [Candidatus Alcyoniella australis]|nr:kelch repeat-containing protein [Candidatus Alcyoniella australis]